MGKILPAGLSQKRDKKRPPPFLAAALRFSLMCLTPPKLRYALNPWNRAAPRSRYAASKRRDTTARADLSGYTDAGDISAYAVEAMTWANAEGFITGTTATTINPLGYASRAEVATILMRVLENMGI